MVLDSEREQEREEMWDATLEDEDRYQKEEARIYYFIRAVILVLVLMLFVSIERRGRQS